LTLQLQVQSRLAALQKQLPEPYWQERRGRPAQLLFSAGSLAGQATQSQVSEVVLQLQRAFW
jgi:hypothetical protein